VSGVLVEGHDPAVWARVLSGLLASPARLSALARGAREHAAAFNWPATAERLVGVYTGVMNEAAAAVRA